MLLQKVSTLQEMEYSGKVRALLKLPHRKTEEFNTMQLDRKLQLDVLEALGEVYPDSLLVSNLPRFANDRNFMGTLFYLQEHGLISGGDIRQPGQCRSMVDAQITKTGLDFIADDGGLQAVLGNFQMKFSKDNLVAVVDDSLKKSSVPDSKRQAIVASLNSMEQKILKKFMLQNLAAGVAANHDTLSSLLLDDE